MEGKRTIIIETVNNTKKTIQVDPGITGYQLKQYIFNHVSQSLGIHQMNVYYAGVKIQNSDLLSRFKKAFEETMVVLQEKTNLSEISGLILAYEPDPISQQAETVRMCCGHVVGRDCMTQFIRSLIQAHQFKILCPSFKPNSQRCQVQWEYSVCKKIGVFTLEEMQQFQVGLSQNYMREQLTQCPYCHVNLYRQNLKGIRVRCPKCKNKDFCSNCLLPWSSNNNETCGNPACKANQELLNTCPQDKKFDLKEKGVVKSILTPRYRACPICFIPFKHEQGCKHSECKRCEIYFCWVCLSVKKKQDKSWKCGGAFEYCGSVAPTQILP